MNKKKLTEQDIRSKYIMPALQEAGWDLMSQIREESFTRGKISVRGKSCKRGQGKRADYILDYKPDFPIAVIEAKDNNHSIGDGIQQALEYAKLLNLPFAFSSNGDGFLFHDCTGTSKTIETTLKMNEFPSPDDLWDRYRMWKGLDESSEKIVLQDYYHDISGKKPRYYQTAAINAATEAIAKGQNRILLVMATGTGKTYTAFQIIWRLWKTQRKKRILFLADRNILIDQTKTNDFRPFGGKMTKIRRPIDPSYEIYLGLYQMLTGHEEERKAYKEFSKTFFDLIVIDECHRGSAADDSAWREILEYFSSATQIGLTATPRETKYVSNIEYFGDPVYTYSLKQGIEDGFLAPYKVIRSHIDIDLEGYRPEEGKVDIYGELVEDKVYDVKDYDRTLVIAERDKVVARRVTDFLKESRDQYQKTIIFCVDQEHAARMRQALVNENKDLVKIDSRYVMRITTSDESGKNELSNFIDPESKYPTLVTTSHMLSTGVDVQTCRLIVLNRDVGSMTEFKQIVGRGTRVHEDTEKYFFTLIDFRGATRHFMDPDFDGEPIQIYEPKGGDPIVPPDSEPEGDSGDDQLNPDGKVVEPPSDPYEARKKVYIDGVEVEIIGEQIRYLNRDGNLTSESLRDHTRKSIRKQFPTLDDFLKCWKLATRKQSVIEEMESNGLPMTKLAKEFNKDFDPFDLICHIAFDVKPRTRKERAENARSLGLSTKYTSRSQIVINRLIDKYADEGLKNLDDPMVLKISPFNQLGTPIELINDFGERQDYDQALYDLQSALYNDVV
ncbi:MAG: DEAD/DEAH box helicase family protein [Bacteroidetes bacterium]|nr:DEAD/DEAH box helicase family protein [Bacteroidota bacterium]